MTSKLKLLVATGVVTAAILGANPAFAAGTTSGTGITNNVNVSFQVGGVTQTAATGSDTFVVDRKINLTVAASDTATTNVSPGQNGAITTFVVTNTSNASLDFSLAATQGPATNGGTDNFDVSGLQVFVESGATPGYQPAEDTATFINALAADANKTVYILGNVAAGRATGDVSGVVLTAVAREDNAAATLGAALTNNNGTANGATTVETVFADTGANATEAAGDDYTVAAADISVFKSSRVVSDPINGASNPKAIPGAIVEYCISVANAAGSATATSVAISDTLPADTAAGGVTFSTGSIRVDGTVTSPGASQTCTGGSAGGAFSDPIVSGTLSDIAANSARALIFRVTVD
ncbi:MAG: hypothetical protein V7676_03175 [Parasphingorhabdus sp.]|uniref:hypothetical protein n=1 Tax=Parasphingorhabdus sp. TaxID=2709688 RepID=UPI0030013F94